VKPHLVIGLGNPLMGDEGVGCLLAERLASEPRLPADIEVFDGGTDLLACADRMRGRTRVTLLDALLDPSEPGAVRSFEGDFSALETGQPGAHALSAVAALQLLQAAYPELRDVRFKLIAVAIGSASIAPHLSPPLAAKLPELLDHVLRNLS
jgi:hydrogenase maturation protease